MILASIPGFFEPVSALTHLAGAVVFVGLAFPLLVRSRGDWRRVAVLAIFVASAVALLSISAVYHMLPGGSGGRAVLDRLDGAAIFVVIAGTYTAVHGLFFHGRARWGALILMWGTVGAAIAVFATIAGVVPGPAVTGVYLFLGWTGGLSGAVIWYRLGTRRILWALGGGLLYTLGAAVLELGELGWPVPFAEVVGPHELWHLAVLAAVTMHWLFLFQNARFPNLGAPLARAGSDPAQDSLTGSDLLGGGTTSPIPAATP